MPEKNDKWKGNINTRLVHDSFMREKKVKSYITSKSKMKSLWELLTENFNLLLTMKTMDPYT